MSLELRGITKQFGSLVANDDVNFKVEAGEIHAILGENGAGKSTLMNIVYGLLSPDKGQILVDGQEIKIRSPLDALAAGIGMVHQHFMLIPVFTVAENIVLGHEKTNHVGLLDLATAREEIIRVSKEFNFEVDPDALIEELPVGIQQRVEIIRALIYNSKILILDEPTAVLTPQETDELLANMKKLRDSGRSIVFITHKLREVKAVADRISIIRRGKVVGTVEPTASQEEMASLMVGRPVDLTVNKAISKPGKKILEMANLNVLDPSGRALASQINLSVAAGEVVAVAGVQGNGQHGPGARAQRFQLRNNAAGRDRDPAPRQGNALAVRDHIHGLSHSVQIIERLAHAHKDDIGQLAPLCRRRPFAQIIACHLHLSDNLSRRQVPHEGLGARVTEGAVEGAADLAGNA